MKRLVYSILLCVPSLLLSAGLTARERTLHVVTTGDVHASWFAQPYVGGERTRTSLMSVKHYVDSLRVAVGPENVLLLDAGDCLQGDNAAYYFNYVETQGEHLFSRITAYMGYDAVIVGNHDIETGHPVYDKVNSELAARGIPFLAGNAVRVADGKPYFPAYALFDRAGMKVAVLGFTNPNMKAWLSEPVWSGMDFLSLLPCVQGWVDTVQEKEKPDAVVVVVHAGTGEGDGLSLESQGLDLLESLSGVDVLVCAHDHRPVTVGKGGTWLVNGGARAGHVGHATVSVDRRRGRPGSNEVSAEVVRLDKERVDAGMQEAFRPDFEKVKAFTNRRVGTLAMDMRTRDAYKGMSDYINLVHTVQLTADEAKISFAAPLTYNGTVRAGELVFNDMFTVYPFENQLFVLNMKGSEIRNYLEYSYDAWIQTPGEHVLRIEDRPDARTGARRWSFTGRSYNFDSAAGLVYTVDVTRPFGERVRISALADGSAFDENAVYPVAMTSYRASGGGNLVTEGAGISKEEVDSRIIARYPAIRDMVYEFIAGHENITPELISDPSVLGEWHFVPEDMSASMIEADMGLIF